MIDDSDQIAWLHSDERLELRAACLLTLLKDFGGTLTDNGEPAYSTKGIYGACHDYVSHGNKDVGGIIGYYLANFETYNPA